MDVSTSQQFIDVYNRISKLETDITNVVKEFYSNLVKSYDEIVDTPENLSDFNNDLDFITKDEVENRINNISIDDSNYLKKTGEEKQKCTAPTEFEELYTTTQDPEDSSDKVATTKFVHSLVSNNGDTVTQQIIGAVGKKYITSKAAESMIKERIGEHAYGNVVNLVNKKIEIAVRGIENIISDIDIPSSTSDLVNDSGYITLNDVPGDLVTSVNGLTGDILITIPQVPTNVSSFTNDVGYITDPGVTSVNNRTGAVLVQENVQSDWSATTGLAKILNKPALKAVAVTGDYNDLENTPDLSIYAQVEDLADVAVSGSYTDLTDTPTIVSAFTNDVGYLTEHQDLSNYATITDVQTEVASLVDQAPTTLDTLNELATALGNDPNFATTVASLIGAKYTKPANGIPSTDLASDVQTSLGKANTALQSFTETDPTVPSYVKEITTSDISSWNNKSDFSGSYNDLSDKPTIPTIPTNVSAFTNDAGYLTSYTETDPTVPAWAKASAKPTYSYSEITNTPTLATVATSGSYNDLSNKPTIPEADVALTTSELDEAWGTVFVATISFSISSVTYQAEKGMTWEEWVASNYNTNGFYLGYNGRGVFADDKHYIKDGDFVVDKRDIIIEDRIYSLGSGKI